MTDDSPVTGNSRIFINSVEFPAGVVVFDANPVESVADAHKPKGADGP